jgi:hypothetical protein
MKRRKLIFDTKKSERKSRAIEAYRSGLPVAQIAENLNCSRETIYRWLKNSREVFSKKKIRAPKSWSSEVRFLVLEFFVLLRAPSLRILALSLRQRAALDLSEAQLRGILKKMSLYEWRPSRFYSRVVTESKISLPHRAPADGSEREKEIAPTALGHSEWRGSSDPRAIKRGRREEAVEPGVFA